jgi:four helix bundle protein
MAKGYRNLEVYNKAYDLSLNIYEITKNFPKEERYGITSQLRRASISIPINIAEGSGRRTLGEYVNQVSSASGSCNEMEVLLDLSFDLDYLDKELHDDLFNKQNRICKMLSKLRTALEDKKDSRSRS